MPRSRRPPKKKRRCCGGEDSTDGALQSQERTPQTSQCAHTPTETCTSACTQSPSATTGSSTRMTQANQSMAPQITATEQASSAPMAPATADSQQVHATLAPGPFLHLPAHQPRDADLDSDSSDSENQGHAFSFSDALARHADTLMANGMSYQEPMSTPISSQIPKKVKKQIWANKFIDFATLLPNSDPSTSNLFTLQLDSQSNIAIVPSQRSKKSLSIELWTSAFLRFVAVYAERFPLETPALMKYGELVRDLASKRPGLAFAQYDAHFRKLRESVPFPWDRIHTEFWLMCSLTPVTPSPLPNRTFRTPNSFRRPAFSRQNKFLDNTCWIYNRRGECRQPNCPHPHICGYCKSNHPATKCSVRNKPPTSSITSLPTQKPLGHKPSGK